MTGEKPFLCGICFKPVDLNKCKVDEGGRVVHPECYAEMLLYRPEVKKPAKKSTILGTWRSVT